MTEELTLTRRQIANRKNASRPRKRRLESYRPDAAIERILAAEVVAESVEERPQFDRVLQAFRDSWRPVGQMEEVLVEKITVSYWRMRRILRVEAADIARQAYWLPVDMDCKQQEISRTVNMPVPAQDREALERIARGERSAPEPDLFALLAQHETLLERQFYRAVRTLERLQAIRLGRMAQPCIEYDGL